MAIEYEIEFIFLLLLPAIVTSASMQTHTHSSPNDVKLIFRDRLERPKHMILFFFFRLLQFARAENGMKSFFRKCGASITMQTSNIVVVHELMSQPTEPKWMASHTVAAQPSRQIAYFLSHRIFNIPWMFTGNARVIIEHFNVKTQFFLSFSSCRLPLTSYPFHWWFRRFFFHEKFIH